MRRSGADAINVRAYVLWGIVVGIVAGVAEALITAIGSSDYWSRAWLHWCQIGFAGWMFGGVCGYVVAKRVERWRAADGRTLDQADRPRLALLCVVLLVLLWSAIGPRDGFTWLLEVTPVLIGVPLLLATARFRWTNLAYLLIAIHATILCIGGHYTYAEVPLFNWIRDALHQFRNHYDRLGHLVQGFVPAVLTRELLLRRTPLHSGGWLFTLVTCVCLGISAAYELIEWLVAISTGEAADAFLGLQGDAWDTQKDMALALAGAVLAQLLLGRAHNRAIARLNERHPPA
ncbi:MAG: hypothetical protein CHACPFDD_03461 [Phycisphaerae bacterium]|nr:hypothetical protein [Phycisphaerae bacterium]